MKNIFKKTRRRNNKGIEENKNLNKYKYGIKTIEKKLINEKQLITIKKLIKKTIKTKGNFYCKISLNKNVTKKPEETRMGNGKGDISHKAVNLKQNKVLFEIDCPNKKIIKLIIKKIKNKIKIKLNIIINE